MEALKKECDFLMMLSRCLNEWPGDCTTLGLLVMYDNKSISCFSHSELSFLFPESYLPHFLTLEILNLLTIRSLLQSRLSSDSKASLPFTLWEVSQSGESVAPPECERAQSRSMGLPSQLELKADFPGSSHPLQ